jgi:hypothetical protein
VHDQISDPNVPIFGLKSREAIDSKTACSVNRVYEPLWILKLSEPETKRTDTVCHQYVSPGHSSAGNPVRYPFGRSVGSVTQGVGPDQNIPQ